MNEASAISIRGLVKHYGAIAALRGVNLDVRKGEIFGFLGPNGAGKTTTIRCLLDLIRPQAGSMSVLGLNPQADPERVRARCGYLPGELHFEDDLTVEHTLRYLSELRGGKGDWPYATTLAERIGLDLRPQVKNLSKGNKQKVGLVQALMHHPDLLLLDEPTSGLDPLVQREVLQIVSEARRDGATVFFSSHILSEVQVTSDRVGIIREGEVVEIADMQTLIQRGVRRVDVRFRGRADASALSALPGVTLLGASCGHQPAPRSTRRHGPVDQGPGTLPDQRDRHRTTLSRGSLLEYYGPRPQQGA